jgi:hypothetical protein
MIVRNHWEHCAGTPCGSPRIGDSDGFGAGVDKNYAQAVSWYRKAATLGNDYAVTQLQRLGEKVTP